MNAHINIDAKSFIELTYIVSYLLESQQESCIIGEYNKLVDKIAQALLRVNNNYIVSTITLYGEECPYLPNLTRFKYALERYCLCNQCDRLGRSKNGIMQKIDKDRLQRKAETADLWITRDIYAMARHNIIGRRSRVANVFLIVTRDPYFKSMMVDLKQKNITVMLAQPDKVKIGVEGFYAAWSVSDLVSGKTPTCQE